MPVHKGSCHCGAIGVELSLPGPPKDQVIGACQCAFCRKHNARAYSNPKANLTLTAHEAIHLQRYAFGLKTAESVICRRCGVYVAMVLIDAGKAWSTVNIDVLDDRSLFSDQVVSRDFSAEDTEARITRRRAQWVPTQLIGWPD